MNDQVDILLATYQGSRYLQEQIESILHQNYPYIHLWIRDDRSSDSTQTLLERFAYFYPDRISIIPSHQRKGIRGNFSELMGYSKANYIMFADQDDKWLPNKIDLSLKAMKKLEVAHGDKVPLLIHTDLKVVKADLSIISESFWKYACLDPNQMSMNYLLTQNRLTGCTMLMNRPLLEIAVPIPDDSLMHDWWVALAAGAFGYIGYVNEPTMLYRQHNSNDTGAKKYGIANYVKRSIADESKRNSAKQTYQQAQLFLDRYALELDPANIDVLKAYAGLSDASYAVQKMQILKYKFFKSGFLRNLKHLLLK